MSDETPTIPPALTAEEWARFPDIAGAHPAPGQEPVYHRTKHGIAAANLHGQPFGFTREDVRQLEALLDIAGGIWDDGPPDEGWQSAKLSRAVGHTQSALLPKLRALLPPEG